MSHSLSKLSCLGSGFVVLPVGGARDAGRHLIKSVPTEFNVDHIALIALAAEGEQKSQPSQQSASVSSSGVAAAASSSSSSKGCIRASDVCAKLGWSAKRTSDCVSLLLEEGMVWLDAQATEPEYWLPTFVGEQ